VENIKVLIRVRPYTTNDDISGMGPPPTPLIETTDRTVTTHGRTTEVFTFDMVADDKVTQEEIFRAVGKDITDSCLQGYNGTIMC